jgi:hypothetical protein
MSNESYRILNDEEVNKYIDLPWFKKECKFIPNYGWAVPEKYLLKEIDRKKFYRSKLEELLHNFEFAKVWKVMKALDWKWAGCPDTPNVSDMTKVVEHLYNSIEKQVLNGRYTFASTGGFTLTYNPNEDHELKLVFEAVNYSVYGD